MVQLSAQPRYAAVIRRFLGVVALVGLFAMHGLAGHGTGHEMDMGSPAVLSTSASMTHGMGNSMSMGMATTEVGTEPSATPDDQTPEPSMMSLVGLCLAILLLAFVLAVSLGRGFTVHRNLLRRVLAIGWPARARRDRDPPCLFTLSIQRC